MEKSHGNKKSESLWDRHGESFIQGVVNLVGLVLVMGFFFVLIWGFRGFPSLDHPEKQQSMEPATPSWQKREADRHADESIKRSQREAEARERELDAYDKGLLTDEMLNRLDELSRRSRARKDQKAMWDHLTRTKELERLRQGSQPGKKPSIVPSP